MGSVRLALRALTDPTAAQMAHSAQPHGSLERCSMARWGSATARRAMTCALRIAASAAVIAVVLVGIVSSAPAGAATSSVLSTGQVLGSGSSLLSANGQYQLTMQQPGNLVLYESPSAGARPLWWTPVYASGSFLVMQSDCNLVIYGPSGWEWQSGTAGHGSGCRLIAQNDGNLVIYSSAGPVWATGTHQQVLYTDQQLKPDDWISSPNGQYNFIMQQPGNAVLYHGNTPLWWTPTYAAGSYLVMQNDCNLVIYGPSGWEWQSRTGGDGSSCYLTVSNTGNLQVFNSTGAVWSTNTGTGTGSGLGTSIVNIASGQVGYTSPYSSSFCNKYTEYWQDGSSCADGTRSQEWCADFAAWVWRQAGVSFTYGYGSGDINATAASFYQWAVATGHWHAAGSGYAPQPGDAVVFGLNSGGTYADHELPP